MQQLLPTARHLDADDLLDLYDCGESACLRGGFVLTTDGGVAWDGGSRPLQTPADSAVFSALRAVADAVVVGAGTARSEGYGPVRLRPAGRAWRVERGRSPEPPPLVVVSRSLELDPGERFFSGPSLVLTCAASDPRRRESLSAVTEVLVVGDEEVDLLAAVRVLHERGLRRLLCEGGPTLLTAVLAAGLLDELCLTLTPLLLGAAPTLLASALPAPRPLELRSLVHGGDGVLLARYAVGGDRVAEPSAPAPDGPPPETQPPDSGAA